MERKIKTMKKINDNKMDITNELVLVDFFATWCGPCKMLSLVLDKLDEEKIIDIYKVDVDENGSLAEEYGIRAVPTLVLFKDKKEIKRLSGYRTLDELKGWINDEK